MGEASRPWATRRVELGAVVGDARTGAAEGETGPHHAGQADLRPRARRASSRSVTVSPRQTSRPIRSMAALNWSRSSALAMTCGVGADHLDAVPLQHAVPRPGPWPGSARSGRRGSAAGRRAAPPRSPWRRSPR